ncbi:MAG TPA: DEAD/DEAH box helicase [Flavobacterium sp.]|nr:DEAD/DEAH box helicase [Flavobacterium sp.]
MNSFSAFDLPKSLQKAVDALGFEKPTPIQSKAFKAILSGRDVMAIAQTGTGKTFAYLLPILKQWKFISDLHIPRVVILVPTRELVVQVVAEIEKLTAYMNIRTLGIYGGVNINTQKTQVYNGTDILVATPGRIMDLALDNVVRFDALQKLVIDEFDEILNLGFKTQLTAILSMMRSKKQNILFSATMTDEVDELLEEYFDFPQEISLVPSGTPLEQISQYVYCVPNFLTKLNVLQYVLENDNSTTRVLIFINSKRISEVVFDFLEEHFVGQFGVINSNKTQNYRLQTMDDFKSGNLRGLVTTDIMARGLDISNVSHVFNLQFPDEPERYIHRIGRTGRADKQGIAISFIAPKEEETLFEVESLMQMEIEILDIPKNVVVEVRKLEFEKDKVKMKVKKTKIDEERGASFHEKSKKNSKVNLGGPGKRYKKVSGSTNRNMERKRDAKKKNKK